MGPVIAGMARSPPDESRARSGLTFPLLAFPFPLLAFLLRVPRFALLRPSPRRPAYGHSPCSSLAGILGISLRLASRALSAGGAPSTGEDLSAASASSCLTDLRQILRT